MKKPYTKVWYTPMSIAKLGLIQNSRGDQSTVSGNYNFILELIKSGTLKARNYSTGKTRKNYLVSAKEIARYHDQEDGENK